MWQEFNPIWTEFRYIDLRNCTQLCLHNSIMFLQVECSTSHVHADYVKSGSILSGNKAVNHEQCMLDNSRNNNLMQSRLRDERALYLCAHRRYSPCSRFCSSSRSWNPCLSHLARKKKGISEALVRERNISFEWPLLVCEVSASFY
jgi:hypothetical protein